MLVVLICGTNGCKISNTGIIKQIVIVVVRAIGSDGSFNSKCMHLRFYLFFFIAFVGFYAGAQTVQSEIFKFESHPFNQFKSVQPPTWDLYNNEVHFTVLRDFRISDGKLVGFHKQFEKYCNTYKLGDVIWPNAKFLRASNIQEMCDELKRRNLYLYQIWGFVPGSPPGNWQQFELADKTSNIFENTLGPRWLGMDVGEQDGRYAGGFAHQYLPKTTNRFIHYMNFRKHIGRIENMMDNKLAGLLTLPLGHYYAKEGIYTSLASEAAQMHPNSQVAYAFIRGAGKQYGVPWYGNVSYFNRWGYKRYGNNPALRDGTSLSLMRRMLYTHIMYNCMVVGFEGNWFDGNELSPIGQIQQQAQAWTKEYGLPGAFQSPIGIMVDFFAGWCNPNYNGILYKVWGNMPYERGDYFTHNVFELLYPGYANSSFFHNEKGFLSPTPFGDSADALLSDAPLWLLKKYKVLVIAGALQGGAEVKDKLEAYVKSGGKLFITSASFENLPGGIGTIRVSSEKVRIKKGTPIRANQTVFKEQYDFDCKGLIPGNGTVIASTKENPIIINEHLGKGEITVFASDFGVSSQVATRTPVRVTVDKDLPNPYPILNHVKHELSKAFETTAMFDLNKELSYTLNYKGKNKFLLTITNSHWQAKEIQLSSKIGRIKKLQELELKNQTREAVGYVPKGMEDVDLGKNTDKYIEGGGMRIFEIEVDALNLVENTFEFPSKKDRKCFLPVANLNSISEEICKRPTLHQNFEGVVIPYSYIKRIAPNELEKQANWIKRRKVKVMVDMTADVNLFPGLTLINGVDADYRQSMKEFQQAFNNFHKMGVEQVILPIHVKVENTLSEKQQLLSLRNTLKSLSKSASQYNIDLNVRLRKEGWADFKRNDIVAMICNLKCDNLKLALSITDLLIAREQPDMDVLEKTGLWLVSGARREVTGEFVNVPLHTHGNKEDVKKYVEMKSTIPVVFDVFYNSHDEAYLDAKWMRNLNEE